MIDLAETLQAAAGAVLETMFFSAVFGPAPDAPAGPGWSAVVDFSGRREGSLAVGVPEDTAHTLAASFLGAEGEVPDAQVGAVVGELANMMCGVVLGQLDPDGRFSISAPRVGHDGGMIPPELAVRCSLELAEGTLVAGATLV